MNSERQPWTLHTAVRANFCRQSESLIVRSQYARAQSELIDRTMKTFSGWYSSAYEM